MAFLQGWDLMLVGFKKLGKDVKISDKAVFYNPSKISIGDYSRIDDFVILSAGDAGIEIGRYVHIACYASILGQGKTTLADFSAISGGTRVYSSSDPYDGSLMTNPCIPEKVNGVTLRKTYHKDVYIGKHVVIGAGSVVLPGARLSDGCSVGALSLVSGDSGNSAQVFAGIPARPIKARNFKKLTELEKVLDAASKNN